MATKRDQEGNLLPLGECPDHGTFIMDAPDSPCPSCEDGEDFDDLENYYGMRIVLRGNLSEGFRAFGPFNNFEEAAGWCDDNANTLMQDWIIPLEDPNALD